MEKKNIKIAFFLNKFPVISETFILNEITGAIDNGFNVKIIAQPETGIKKMHTEVMTYHLLEKVSAFRIPASRIIRIAKAFFLLIWLFFVKPSIFFRIMKNRLFMNFPVIYLSLHFLKIQDFDILYCHFGHNGRLAAILKQLGIIKSRIITVFHGFEISKKKYLVKGYYDVLFREGDLFLPVSYIWKQRLTALGCDEKKIVVHRMGIDLDRFTVVNNLLKDNTVKLLTIARLTEKKGIEYAIRALHYLINEYRISIPLTFTIIGDGELKEELHSLAINLGLTKIVHFSGFMSREEVIAGMQDSNIFILPSVTGRDGNMEGIPVVLMEAMAMGLPIISTFHSGIPELVKDGETGFLVKERDVQGLAEKIFFMINNSSLWSEIGARGRKKIETDFNNKKLNNDLKGIFEKMVKS